MPASKAPQVDLKRIRKAIEIGAPLAITTYSASHETETYISSVLSCFLKEIHQEELQNQLSYCVQELTVNAGRANTKRVYFKEKNLDIANLEDYNEGMKRFKNDIIGNANYYTAKQKEEGLYVKVIFLVKNGDFTIEVRNNAEMVSFEYMRVHDKIARARQFAAANDSLINIIDDTEGAGLGIIIIIQILRNLGLSEYNYEIDVENGETISKLTIPQNADAVSGLNKLTKGITEYITALPPFPENISAIQRLLDDPEAKISEIASHVSADLALAADLLKEVNSAAVAMSRRCDNISDAIKYVGMRGLKNILYSYGTHKIIDDHGEKQEALWEHCYRVAYFAFNLVMNFVKNKKLAEDAYTCGILHDMGKAVFLTVQPQMLNSIQRYCVDNGIASNTLESVVMGINHAEVGAAIAEKWRFPDTLVYAIRFHHNPETAPAAVKRTVSYVALANGMCNYLDGLIEFYQIDKNLLSGFSIAAESDYRRLAEQLNVGFEQTKTTV